MNLDPAAAAGARVNAYRAIRNDGLAVGDGSYGMRGIGGNDGDATRAGNDRISANGNFQLAFYYSPYFFIRVGMLMNL